MIDPVDTSTARAQSAATRVVMYGIGAMGSLIVRMLVEKGAEVVGAVARSEAKIGRDIGQVAGLRHELGVTVDSDIDDVLARTRPDVVVMTIASYMEEMEKPTLRCLEAGANVLSLSEELLYSRNTSPEATARIDAAAKRHGVSFMCSGQQDGFWVSLVAVLMGTAHRVDKVAGVVTWNVDDFGAELAHDQQVGVTVEQFEDWARNAQRPPTFGRTALELLADVAGLHPTAATTVSRPEVARADMHCAALQRPIPKGRVTGFTDVDTVRTREGVDLVLENTGKVYLPNESDVNEWRISGDPDLNLRNDNVPTHVTTCATLVNRIPQVIAARPGYLTVGDLPQLSYRHRLH